MLGIFFALLSALAQSLHGLINKKLLSAVQPHILLPPILAGAAVFSLLPALWGGLPELNATFFAAAVPSAVSNTAAFLFLLESLKRDNLSRVFPFLSLAPLFAVLTSFLILKEMPSPQGAAGIILIISGLAIIEIKNNKESDREKRREHKTAIIMALLTAASFAVSISLDKLAILNSSPSFYPLFIYAACATLSFIYLPARQRAIGKRGGNFPPAESDNFFSALKQNRRPIILNSFIIAAGTLFNSFALNFLLASYVSALKRFGIIFGVLWGIIFLKEGGGIRLAMGSILAVFGAILIALG